MRQAIHLRLICLGISTIAQAATPVATYQFKNTFAADEPGVPALTVVDPLGTSGFVPDSVFGENRSVWEFNGNSTPAEQAGLTISTINLVNPQAYSVDMVFEFFTRANAWRRILDVQNRQSDAGFYVDPSNNLNIFPVAGSTAAWTNNVYHHVVFTNDGTTVRAYLDGVSQLSIATTEMNLNYDPVNNPNRLLGFFIDNVVGGGQSEYSTGRISLARIWNGVLTSSEAQAIAGKLPSVLAWRSVRTHAGSGDLSIVLNTSASGNGQTGPTVETRIGGIQKIQVDFDQAMTIANPSAISVTGRSTTGGVLGAPVDYTPLASISMSAPTTLQLAFNPGALPDQTCYTFVIGAALQNTSGASPVGATISNIRALVGDTTGSGEVNLSDALAIAVRMGTAATLSPASDVDLSGGNISISDALAAKARVTSPALKTLCP